MVALLNTKGGYFLVPHEMIGDPAPNCTPHALSLADLRAMLAAGMVEPCGATEGAGVVSYRLTSVGRIVLENQLRKEPRG